MEKKEEILNVLKANLREWTKLDNAEYLLEVKFDDNSYDGLFCWTGRSKGNHWVFPLSNWNTVIHFKTEKGAKRNFLKKYYSKEYVMQVIKEQKGGLNSSQP